MMLEVQTPRRTITTAILITSICLVLILPITFTTLPNSYSSIRETTVWIDDDVQNTAPNDTDSKVSDYYEVECSSIIVTGNASKDGRAILMKNRDWPMEQSNLPIYIPATSSAFAYVGVNTNTMGINERGLAVMNTAMPILENEPGIGNLILNQKILEGYESVNAVAKALNDSQSIIGPKYRSFSGAIATCLGIIDRFGVGAFFEVSNTEAYVQYIVDGYDTRANHPRIFPGLASGPSGRDQYLLDALDAVYAKNGVITWEDVMQNASRYVRNKELGSSSFSIDGEACNTGTVAAMIAVSGDLRYEGKLNIMWGAYGFTPLVSVFVPSMVIAGEIPVSVERLWSCTCKKYLFAQVQYEPVLLDPYRVREIQDFSFFAEEYTIDEYDRLMSSVPHGLTNYQLQTTLHEFIDRADDYATEVFVKESKSIEVPESVDFPIPTTTTTTTITTSTSTTSVTSPTITPVQTDSSPTTSLGNTTTSVPITGIDSSLAISLSTIGAVGVLILAISIRRRTPQTTR